jgi:hypothetical protein
LVEAGLGHDTPKTLESVPQVALLHIVHGLAHGLDGGQGVLRDLHHVRKGGEVPDHGVALEV